MLSTTLLLYYSTTLLLLSTTLLLYYSCLLLYYLHYSVRAIECCKNKCTYFDDLLFDRKANINIPEIFGTRKSIDYLLSLTAPRKKAKSAHLICNKWIIYLLIFILAVIIHFGLHCAVTATPFSEVKSIGSVPSALRCGLSRSQVDSRRSEKKRQKYNNAIFSLPFCMVKIDWNIRGSTSFRVTECQQKMLWWNDGQM